MSQDEISGTATPVLPFNQALSAKTRVKALTKQQIAVLDLASQGLLEREVALRLDISIKTVKFHKTGAYKTLKAKNLTQALLAYRLLHVPQGSNAPTGAL